MAKKKEDNHAKEDLPTRLLAALVKAEENREPDPTTGDRESVPDLWELLAPKQVFAPQKDPEAKPRKVWREPMLTLFWSKSAGAWVVSVTDRVLKVKLSVLVKTLAGSILEASEAIRDGRYDVRGMD